VPVHDRSIMGMRQSVRDLDAISEHTFDRQPGICDQSTQRSSFDEFHHYVEFVPSLADLMDGADVRMVQTRSRTRLAQQVIASKLVERIFGQDLKGDIALQKFVVSAIDDAHSAFADLAQDAIVVNRSANHQRQYSPVAEQK